MSTLVHIGDFHADPGPRNADRYRALDQIIGEGLALPNLGAWLWPGDLFHARSNVDDRNALAARLQRMAAAAPVFICYGNHDQPGDLDVFERLRSTSPIRVFAQPTTVKVVLATGEAATMFVLPYPTKGGLVAAGIAKPDVIPTAADLLEPIFMAAAADLEAARARGELTFMMGHVNVAGSITSAGQPNIGHEIEITAAHLDRLGSIPKLLNHIHKGQEIAGAHYAGSVCRLNWGEIEDKRYLVIDFMGRETFDVVSKPVDVRPLYHVEGTLTREGFVYQVKAGPGGAFQDRPASWKDCEVRVRYKFNQSEKSVLRDAQVLAEFAEAARLEVEPIAVPDRALRAPAVAEARTLAEKLRAWGDVAGVTVQTESVLAKLAALEHKDPLVLLSEIQTSLAAIETGENETVAA